jgi:VWFA-related protein
MPRTERVEFSLAARDWRTMSTRTLPVSADSARARVRTRLRVGASFACLLAAGAFVPAQRMPEGSPAPQLRLDVVVTNDLGGAITGLRAADFAVREDGTSRPVEAAEFRWIRSDNFTSVPPILTRADEEREARRPGTRVFAFLLDEFHVRPGVDSHAVRDAVASFIDEKMFASDLAVVARPLDALASLRFTRDRATLMGNVAAFSGRKGRYVPRTPHEATLVGSDPDAVPAARERVLKASLRDLAERLAQLDADRAVVVLVSEGFSSQLPIDSTEPDLASLVAASSQFHFPIYVLNPARLPAGGGERAEGTATLRWLADRTGGLFIRAEDAIAGFASVFHDTHGYYALRYRPAHADGRFHDIEIVSRNNKRVRGSSIYWAANDEARAVQGRSAIADWPRLRQLRRSPLIDAWAGVRVDDAGRAQMIVTWEPRPGQPARPEHVVLSAKTATGASIFEGSIAAVGTGAPSADRARFEVPAGRVELDLNVLDGARRLLDTDVRDVDVPDLSASGQPGPVLLPVEVICTRSGRASETTPRSDALAAYAARGCSRGSRLIVRVPAADPTGTAVRVTARLLNRAGQTMRVLEADPGLDSPTQFTLPLASFAPGQYAIEVTGQNGNGVVSDRVTFRVES